LKISTERIEDCQVVLSIEIDAERVEHYMRRAARRLSNRMQIPGFRKGKAPYNLVLQRLGREALIGEALEELSGEVFKEALEESGIEPIDQAKLESVEGEPLTLKMIVPVAPVVELSNYRQIRLEPEEVSVDDEAVEEVLKEIQKNHAEQRPVQRPAQRGDIVVMDVKATVEGEAVFSDEERTLILETDALYPLPGFSEQVVGMVIGEDREFDLPYPEDSNIPDLAGKEVHFTVHLYDIKEEVLPALDDDLAMTAGDYETLDELRASARESLQLIAEREAEERFIARVLEEVTEGSRAEFPPVLLERELDDMVAEQDRLLRQQRGLTLDNYLQTIQVSAEDFRADLRPRASERLTRFLVLNEVAQAEGVQVSPDEIEKEIERLSQPYGEQAETMKKILSSPTSQSSLNADLLIRKAIEHLVAIARGEVPTEEDLTPGQQLETQVDGSSAPDETEEDAGREPGSSDKASNDRKQ
jgi:trigger factor